MLNELFILAKIREGDIKAFEEIFRRYYSPLFYNLFPPLRQHPLDLRSTQVHIQHNLHHPEEQ